MRTIKTYFKRAPFYNAFTRTESLHLRHRPLNSKIVGDREALWCLMMRQGD
jgi:hypothetical protein